jgi:hypothetical protein
LAIWLDAAQNVLFRVKMLSFFFFFWSRLGLSLRRQAATSSVSRGANHSYKTRFKHAAECEREKRQKCISRRAEQSQKPPKGVFTAGLSDLEKRKKCKSHLPNGSIFCIFHVFTFFRFFHFGTRLFCGVLKSRLQNAF